MIDHNAEILFVYGTLRDREVLESVLGHSLDSLSLVAATALGYRTVYYPRQLYPALIPVDEDVASGIAITGLSQSDMERLDAYEGDEYQKGQLRVVANGLSFDALAYLPAQVIDPAAPRWTFEVWVEKDRARWIVEEPALGTPVDHAPTYRERTDV